MVHSSASCGIGKTASGPGSGNSRSPRGQLDLRPLQIAQLGRPQAVAVDHSRVPMAVAAGLPSGRHQALDLGRRQVEKSTTRSISTADFLSHVDQLG